MYGVGRLVLATATIETVKIGNAMAEEIINTMSHKGGDGGSGLRLPPEDDATLKLVMIEDVEAVVFDIVVVVELGLEVTST